MAKRKYKTFKYDDEEREMFSDSTEAFMLRLKRNPVPKGEPSWRTIIHDTQKYRTKKKYREKTDEENRDSAVTGKRRKTKVRF